MRTFGRGTVSEFLGDFIVYRNLAPCDSRLPTFSQVQGILGVPGTPAPRKIEPAYASVVAQQLRHARRLDLPGETIQRVVFLGDTRLLDATAFENLCGAGGWRGMVLICSETDQPAQATVDQLAADRWILTSNRWSALEENPALNPMGESFTGFCERYGFPIDEGTALLVDLDKTAIGARGRNAQVIDQARQQAVFDTVAGALGGSFDNLAFQTAHKTLSQPMYHPLTEDNQDYLAYICLVVSAGLFPLEELDGQTARFGPFIQMVEGKKQDLSPSLLEIHREIIGNVLAGDPTPFKSFRYQEYTTTIRRMGCLPDGTGTDQLLQNEIVITHEVMETALAWKKKGALVFGLSDKPDEASLPRKELADKGWLPLHKTETHVVGS